MPSKTFEIQGMAEFRQKMNNAGAKAMPYLKRAMWEIGKEAMTESQELVPVLTGTLKNSGQPPTVEVGGSEIVVTLGYGGAASAYALAVHENPSAHSPRSWVGTVVHFGNKNPKGQSHFLSVPVKKKGRTLGTDLARKIGGSIERAIARGA